MKDLPLAHAFNARFEVQPGKPLVFTMPGSVGFAFTHFVEESGSQQQYEVLINGLLVRRGSAPYIGIGGYDANYLPGSNPPLIVPPGGTLTVKNCAPTGVIAHLGGYFISAADLGR